jgi:hypothetical protein
MTSPNRFHAPARLTATLLLIVMASAGCASDPTQGYSTTDVFPEHIKTIAVPILGNTTFIRGVEFDLTDALIKEIEARTPYHVTTQARADSILVANIQEVELDQISKSRLTGLGEEVLVKITIDFSWRDLLNDTTLVERKSFTGQRLFVPSNPTGERVELGRMATVQMLAQDVVGTMRAGW